MKSFIAIVHKDTDSDYGVSFPDFPGCITAGSTLGEAQDMAQAALEAHTAHMLREGQLLPEPMSPEEAIHQAIAETPEGFVAALVVGQGQSRLEA